MKNILPITLLVLSTIVLTACVSSQNLATNTFPVANVLKKVVINGSDETIYGLLDSDDYAIRLAIEPINNKNPTTVVFKGHTLIQAQDRGVGYLNGKEFFNKQSERYYFPDSYIYAGGKGLKEGQYELFTSQYPVPKTAFINSSGKLTEGYSYDTDGSKTQYTHSWQLQKAKNINNANLCVYEEYENKSETRTCYTITKMGIILDTNVTLISKKPPFLKLESK